MPGSTQKNHISTQVTITLPRNSLFLYIIRRSEIIQLQLVLLYTQYMVQYMEHNISMNIYYYYTCNMPKKLRTVLVL